MREDWRRTYDIFLETNEDLEPEDEELLVNVDPRNMGEFAIAMHYFAASFCAAMTSSVNLSKAPPEELFQIHEAILPEVLTAAVAVRASRAHMLAVLDEEGVLPESLVPTDFDMEVGVPGYRYKGEWSDPDVARNDPDYWEYFDFEYCQSHTRPITLREFVERVRASVVTKERAAQAALLRDICGEPAREPALEPHVLLWNDGTVARIAHLIYAERRFHELSVLHDALLDAGCDDELILRHCRQDSVHVRGCWVVDHILRGAGIIDDPPVDLCFDVPTCEPDAELKTRDSAGADEDEIPL